MPFRRTQLSNQEFRAWLEYHEAIKHGERSLRTSHHVLNFSDQPLPFIGLDLGLDRAIAESSARSVVFAVRLSEAVKIAGSRFRFRVGPQASQR